MQKWLRNIRSFSKLTARKILLKNVLMLLVGLCVWLGITTTGLAVEENTGCVAIVTANRLNGRSAPRKTASKEALWDQGDELIPTGEWSESHKWIEVKGGETGTVWCDIRYVTERTDEFVVVNIDYNKVKLRKTPVVGTVIGYLKRDKELWIDQVVLGWGHSSRGWIDLSLVYEED